MKVTGLCAHQGGRENIVLSCLQRQNSQSLIPAWLLLLYSKRGYWEEI